MRVKFTNMTCGESIFLRQSSPSLSDVTRASPELRSSTTSASSTVDDFPPRINGAGMEACLIARSGMDAAVFEPEDIALLPAAV